MYNSNNENQAFVLTGANVEEDGTLKVSGFVEDGNDDEGHVILQYSCGEEYLTQVFEGARDDAQKFNLQPMSAMLGCQAGVFFARLTEPKISYDAFGGIDATSIRAVNIYDTIRDQAFGEKIA